jgi:aminoglycoside/choline kinase family phosphotransferase
VVYRQAPGRDADRRAECGAGQDLRRHPGQRLAQPQVYASRLPFAQPDGAAQGQSRHLDFQDAVYGPITYDLVSLLRDAYIQWDEEMVLDWAIRYWEKARRAGLPVTPDIDTFYRDFEWMGLQRHLKVLGIFAACGTATARMAT